VKARVAAPLAAAMALSSGGAAAATAYVTDELVLNVYAQENSQGLRLTTLHSGAVLEALASDGESTQVRLPDGRTGWVKTSYLTNHEPAVVRLKQLQEEMERGRSATPGVAQAEAEKAAARSEIERLTRELAAAKERRMEPAAAAVAVAVADNAVPAAAAAAHPSTGPEPPVAQTPDTGTATAPQSRGAVAAFLVKFWLTLAAVGVATGLGYWLGYASLARRVRQRFGGIKVY
jgi:hypothetical protein